MKIIALFVFFITISLTIKPQDTKLRISTRLSLHEIQNNPDTIVDQLYEWNELNPGLLDTLSIKMYDWIIADSIQLQHIALYKLGLIRYNLNDFYRAIRLNSMAYEHALKLQDTIPVIDYGNWLAYMLIHDTNYDESLKILLRNIQLSEKANLKYLLERTYLILGINYRSQDNYEKALECFKKALSYSRYNVPINDSSTILNETGNTFLLLNNYDSAYYYQKKALLMRLKSNEQTSLSYSYNDIANTLYSKGDYLKSLFYFKKALEINLQSGQTWTEIKIRYSMGVLYLKMKNLEESKINLLTAEQLSNKVNLIDGLPDIYKSLSDIELENGNYPAAIDYLNKMVVYKDSVMNIEKLKKIAETESRYELKRKEVLIKLLNQQKIIDQKALINKTLEGRAYALAAFIVAIAMFFIYRNYRIKKKANKILTIKNTEIEEQRNELELLNFELLTKKNEIEIQHDIINKKNNKITDSIVYAQYIQKAVLPTEKILMDSFRSYFIIYQPKDIISGDFYWLKDSGSKLIVVVGDCTGHGVPGALMSMLGIAFLNDLLNKDKNIKPNTIIEGIRKQLKFALHQKGEITEISDGIDLAVCSIDKDQEVIEFSGANFSLFCNRNGSITETEGDSQPAGISIDEKPFENQILKIENNDIFYLFTDGYQSQFGGPKYEPIRKKRMLAFLNEICQLPPEKQKEKLESNFIHWKNDNEQTDDILVLAFTPI